MKTIFRTSLLASATIATVMIGAPAFAQDAPAATRDAPAQAVADDIIVTGSRIQRAGFDAPTPTTVLGDVELAQGNRPTIAETLNDMPQFRATTTPVSTVGSSNTGTASVDLRGLGAVRTLTLLNGHRFVGSSDLNTIPQDLVKRVDVVTGGASAAWGSGAVAGVVNIILDDDLTGVRLGAETGISSRGDAARYGANAAWGTNFANGRGHFMVAGSYVDNQGALSRKDRPYLDSALFPRGSGLALVNDANSIQLYNGGTVLNPLTGGTLFVFNPNGTLAPFPYGSETAGGSTIGGGGQNLYDYVAVTAPYQRVNAFARASYDVADSVKFWVQGSYTRVSSDYPFFAEPATPLIAPDNAFLTPTASAQIAAAGLPAGLPFVLGRWLDDVGGVGRRLTYKNARRTIEGAVGANGKFGSWSYGLYYNHGETRDDGALRNQSIAARFENATDAVLVGSTPTCRINADADPTNNDAACVPINLLGNGNITPQAAAYAFGTYQTIQTTTLDAAGVSLNGQPFSTWAGGVDIAIGADLRWEKFRTNYIDPISAVNGFSLINASPLNGSFNVTEFFGELNVPLVNAEKVKLEVNGAARYSDYSTSGGIWTWKTGGTLRLFDDLLLRGVYSRDIRSPDIGELFAQRSTRVGVALIDPYGASPGPATFTVFTGGNPGLTPEISHTLTLGGSYSPRFVSGLRVSVDYYSIDIDNVIATLSPQDTLDQCFAARPGDNTCGGVISRTGTPTITGTNRNLTFYKTRGLDIEASYLLPLTRIGGGDGNLRFRAFATHVFGLLINDGVQTSDRAGIVGDTTTFSTPKWRVAASAGYESTGFSGEVRVRHVAGGRFADDPTIINNRLKAQTYVDLDLRYNVGPFTLFSSVTNLFDANPQYITSAAAAIYDVVGTYASAGVKLKF